MALSKVAFTGAGIDADGGVASAAERFVHHRDVGFTVTVKIRLGNGATCRGYGVQRTNEIPSLVAKSNHRSGVASFGQQIEVAIAIEIRNLQPAGILALASGIYSRVCERGVPSIGKDPYKIIAQCSE